MEKEAFKGVVASGSAGRNAESGATGGGTVARASLAVPAVAPPAAGVKPAAVAKPKPVVKPPVVAKAPAAKPALATPKSGGGGSSGPGGSAKRRKTSDGASAGVATAGGTKATPTPADVDPFKYAGKVRARFLAETSETSNLIGCIQNEPDFAWAKNESNLGELVKAKSAVDKMRNSSSFFKTWAYDSNWKVSTALSADQGLVSRELARMQEFDNLLDKLCATRTMILSTKNVRATMANA